MLYIYCAGGIECLSCTPDNLSMFHQNSVRCRPENTEDCEGWWFSGCHGSVAEHWWLKPEVSWVRLQATAGLFHFPLISFHNIYRHYSNNNTWS